MSKPNIEAKKERHRKLFEGRYRTSLGRIFFHSWRFIVKFWLFIKPSGRTFSRFVHPLDHFPAPRRLYIQMSIWSFFLLCVTSINASSAFVYGASEDMGKEYLSFDSSGTYLTDEEGFLIKNVPLNGEATYDLNRIELVKHEVQAGDTLSLIAYRYGLTVASVRYSNAELRGDYLKVGQVLNIPPKDGIYVKVKSGDSLLELIEKYKGDLENTRQFNGFEEGEALPVEEEIFIVDGRPEIIQVAAVVPTIRQGQIYADPPSQSYIDVVPNAEGWIRPTTGIITCGYLCYGGHYAYDIGNASQPPIVSVGGGTVVTAGWNSGGYGNHIVIDHGNGYQTLYAHAEVLYVQAGETVSQGQVIAKMGRTGRVWGRTGIHLHFELHYNGVKLNPKVMGVW